METWYNISKSTGVYPIDTNRRGAKEILRKTPLFLTDKQQLKQTK